MQAIPARPKSIKWAQLVLTQSLWAGLQWAVNSLEAGVQSDFFLDQFNLNRDTQCTEESEELVLQDLYPHVSLETLHFVYKNCLKRLVNLKQFKVCAFAVAIRLSLFESFCTWKPLIWISNNNESIPCQRTKWKEKSLNLSVGNCIYLYTYIYIYM